MQNETIHNNKRINKMAIIKIGQMTDTHDGDLRAAVDLLNREKVDIGVHSGDIVPENYT